jgi:hypothetical protein
MPDTLHFYRELSDTPSFDSVATTDLHDDLPPDWWIAVTDVVGSTKAIAAGAYKDVNTVGVACITAMLNVAPEIQLPFAFGGDGATFALPDALRERAARALRGVQQLARSAFGLTLRAGFVSVADLQQSGHAARVGKVRLSRHVSQAAFWGSAWDEAERRVKSEGMPGALCVDEQNGPADASFEGFECRWKAFPSVNDHKLSLLVVAADTEHEAKQAVYRRVLEHIQATYGEAHQYHPLRAERMRMTFSPRLLSHEWRVRTSQRPWRQRLGYFAEMYFRCAAGTYLFARDLDTAATQWSRYRDELVENTDFRKFDGMLRMLIDGSEQQYAQLIAYLEDEYRAGRLAYGTSKSRQALVTCIVRSYNGNHMHFVDGSDGGYALAARELKQRLGQAR